MGWKKFIIGEKMPDKGDPKYKERYEKEVDAGRRFARWSRIDILAAKIQNWASRHEKMFLVSVFGIVIGCFVWNMIGIYRVVNAPAQGDVSVSERQEEMLDSLRHSKDIGTKDKKEKKGIHATISKWARYAVD